MTQTPDTPEGFVERFAHTANQLAEEHHRLTRMTRAERDAYLGDQFAEHLGPPRTPSALTNPEVGEQLLKRDQTPTITDMIQGGH